MNIYIDIGCNYVTLKKCVCVYNDSLMRTASKICGHSRFEFDCWMPSMAELSCNVKTTTVIFNRFGFKRQQSDPTNILWEYFF